MKLKPILFSIIFALSTQASASPVEDVRMLLHAGDVDALETKMSAMAASKDQPTIDAYREVADTLFRTSHPVVIETLTGWMEKEPRSSAALAANTWAAIHDHFLKSSPYDFGFFQPLHGEYASRWTESLERAHELGQRAYKAGRNDVSAIDAWLFTQRLTRNKGDIRRAATKLLDLAPDRASVRNIVGAKVLGAQHPGRAAIEACLTYGDRAKDYTGGLCLIEAAFEHSTEQDLRKEAERQLAKVDDPRLDWARLEVAVWSDQKADVETLRQLQLATLNRRYDPQAYDRYAQHIARKTGNPDYLKEMRAVHLEHLEIWLSDDPLNPRFLRHKSGILMEQGALDEARAAFYDGLTYGWIDLNMWIAGAWVAFEEYNLEEAAIYIENGAATAGATTGLLQMHDMLETALRNEAMPAPSEDVQCLRLRMSRLMKGLCDTYGMQVGSVCRADHPMSKSLKATIDATKRACPKFAQKPLSELKFSPMSPKDAAAQIVQDAGN